jgi:hypothetical protein
MGGRRGSSHVVGRRTRAVPLAAMLAAAAAAQPAAEPVPAGFEPLFNGRDLDGWWGMATEDPRALHALSPDARQAKIDASLADIRAHWRVAGDEVINDGSGLYLTTLREFGDFELRIEYRTVPGADSGIYLRGMPQVQIWDPTDASKAGSGADKGSGGLWNNSAGARGKDPLVRADRPLGEWNRFRIEMIGSCVTVHLNDRLVVEDALLENYFERGAPLPRSGPIQLQTHGGEVRWRNALVREIGAEEANAYLRGLDGEDFADAFDGRSLAGWTGATDSYAVVDGAIQCKPGQGGTLHTEREYGDFVADLEIAIPPGGNNGLAIRYPGDGDTAYVGMCELQVLDDAHAKYARLDPRQYHGSAYGMVAARRGYQRPAGAWNHQRVTVRGSKVTVELNGFVILDADLAGVTEFMGGSPHPGRLRARGAFGFAGHGDPVRFRRVRIRALD